MSGRKRSQFRLQRAQQERLNLLRRIRSLPAEVSGFRERVSALLGEASLGLLDTFTEEAREAQSWLEQESIPNVQGLGMTTSLSALRATRTRLEQVAARGRLIQEKLVVAFTQKADEMGQHLVRRLAEVEGRYISGRQLLQLWLAEEHMQRWEQALQETQRLLGEEHYTSVEQRLQDLEREITEKLKWAEEQEDKHQKRLYLLKALRQVCAEMNFKEVAPPRYEREEERGSRILFTVDTWDRGQIAFTLSLDEISSFSKIADDRCFEEFGQLSQYLEEEFGIHTQFHLAEGELPPKRIHKGELDLPGESGIQAEA